MSTREDRLLAGRQVFAKVIQSDVKAAFDSTRKRLEPLLDADEGIAAELPDGTRIGTVKRSKVKKAAAVTDDKALLAWALEHRPDQLVQSVNPAFVEFLKAQVLKHGHAFDPTTGEIIPGVEMREGSPSYLPQPDPEMVPVVRAKFAELIGKGLLELSHLEAS
jgi:hypothetical protein